MLNLKPILLVDDSESEIELAFEAFRKNGITNNLVIARNGVDALDYLFRRGAYAGRDGEIPLFILMDIKMPKMLGTEALRQIKGDAKLKLIPVVMLTNSSLPSDLLECYDLGANGYVIKPVGFENFTQAMGRIYQYWAKTNALVPPHQASNLTG